MNARVKKQEQDAARMVRGRTTLASGALPTNKSDAVGPKHRVECKRTNSQQMVLRLKDIEKITREAMSTGRAPIMTLQFGTKTFVLMTQSFAEGLIESDLEEK